MKGDRQIKLFNQYIEGLPISKGIKTIILEKNQIQKKPLFYLTYASLFHELIRFQVYIIYFHAALGKLDVEEWSNGTALYYWFNHSFFGASDNLIPIINFFLSNSWIVTALTYGVLIFEVLLFLCLLASEKVKRTILIPAILFHFLIIAFHGIFSFFFAVTAGLILYLLPINKPLKFKL